MIALTDFSGLAQARAALVRRADDTDLACLDQLLVCAEHFLGRLAIVADLSVSRALPAIPLDETLLCVL